MKSGLYPYLSFNGNCREAMLFYQHCLGGRLRFQSIGESLSTAKMPGKMRDCVLHCTLTNDSVVLMGTDIVMDDGLIRGNAASMMLHCNTEKELRNRFKKLAVGGRAIQPPVRTFEGALFGNLTDKFGNNWLLYFAGTGENN